MHCEVSSTAKRKNFLDIITPDFAGEAIATELEHPGTHLAISSVIFQSKAVILLIDSLGVRDSGRDEDFFAMKMASYIHNLRTPKGSFANKRKAKVPLAIVLTKSDNCCRGDGRSGTLCHRQHARFRKVPAAQFSCPTSSSRPAS